ncbi:hypothetical protein HDU97_001894 [Phlyctochytrium planicorne]|nr:hypothetical protein HDU97_001894 [Phlyctochytrium planicorne]
MVNFASIAIAMATASASVVSATPISFESSLNVTNGDYFAPERPASFSNEADSAYPPNYITYYGCRYDGDVVSVCAYNRLSNGENPRIKVTYNNKGFLWPQGSPLSVWISINGKSGYYGRFLADPDTNPPSSASFTVASYQDQKICYQATTGDPANYSHPNYSRCPVTAEFPLLNGGFDQGKAVWFYRPAPADQTQIIPAQPAQAWDVQVAIVNAKGNWDSKNGYNYRFRFDALPVS